MYWNGNKILKMMFIDIIFINYYYYLQYILGIKYCSYFVNIMLMASLNAQSWRE